MHRRDASSEVVDERRHIRALRKALGPAVLVFTAVLVVTFPVFVVADYNYVLGGNAVATGFFDDFVSPNTEGHAHFLVEAAEVFTIVAPLTSAIAVGRRTYRRSYGDH
jgi:hypothetical protein